MYVNTEMSAYLPIHPSPTSLPVNTHSCLLLFVRSDDKTYSPGHLFFSIWKVMGTLEPTWKSEYFSD